MSSVRNFSRSIHTVPQEPLPVSLRASSSHRCSDASSTPCSPMTHPTALRHDEKTFCDCHIHPDTTRRYNLFDIALDSKPGTRSDFNYQARSVITAGSELRQVQQAAKRQHKARTERCRKRGLSYTGSDQSDTKRIFIRPGQYKATRPSQGQNTIMQQGLLRGRNSTHHRKSKVFLKINFEMYIGDGI